MTALVRQWSSFPNIFHFVPSTYANIQLAMSVPHANDPAVAANDQMSCDLLPIDNETAWTLASHKVRQCTEAAGKLWCLVILSAVVAVYADIALG